MIAALVKNNYVVSVIDTDVSEIPSDCTIVDITGQTPQPSVGWMLDGNKLKPYYDVRTSKQAFLDAGNPLGVVEKSIQERKIYAEDMLDRFKKMNIAKRGVNIAQAMWLHHKCRKMSVMFAHPVYTNGEVLSMELDLMNLAIPGDIEVACIALQCLIPGSLDDMSKPWHFFDSETRNWLVKDMKQFLGWS